ncbi:interferon a3-like [Scomber scombrus]|uniref:Interferon a3-like n=1 Tax=Scomber scombrus TaxID=13677 RepID=A0AAV1PV75_SCOSC
MKKVHTAAINEELQSVQHRLLTELQMVNNSTNTTEDAELEVAFPHDLYTQASKASAGEHLGFIVQSLEQMALLFEEAHNSTSWQEKTVEDFVNVVSRQADGLRSCIGSHNHKNKKLRMYFKRLWRYAAFNTGSSSSSETNVVTPSHPLDGGMQILTLVHSPPVKPRRRKKRRRSCRLAEMSQHNLSAVKRLTKPFLFGTLIVGLATAFFNRHLFMEDLADIRAQERARMDAKRMEIMERRQKQIDEVAEKKKGGSS